jgi:hypothetical protein
MVNLPRLSVAVPGTFSAVPRVPLLAVATTA